MLTMIWQRFLFLESLTEDVPVLSIDIWYPVLVPPGLDKPHKLNSSTPYFLVITHVFTNGELLLAWSQRYVYVYTNVVLIPFVPLQYIY